MNKLSLVPLKRTCCLTAAFFAASILSAISADHSDLSDDEKHYLPWEKAPRWPSGVSFN